MGVVGPDSTSHADISHLVGGEDECSSGPGRGMWSEVSETTVGLAGTPARTQRPLHILLNEVGTKARIGREESTMAT